MEDYLVVKVRADAMSGAGGGYTLALRDNRVDYSVSKGGLRLWAVLFVFIVLCSSLYTVFSVNKNNKLNIPVDFDGGGDDDDNVNMGKGTVDDDGNNKYDEASSSLNQADNNKKLNKEKEDDDRQMTPKLTGAPGTDRSDKKRRKTTTIDNQDADDGNDEDEEDADDDDDDDDDVDNDDDPVENLKPESSRRNDEEDEEEEDRAESSAREEMMLRALKEKADARRHERQEKRAAKKAARQAARQHAAAAGERDDEPDEDEDDDEEEEDQTTRPTPRKSISVRKVRFNEAADPSNSQKALEKKPEPEPESQADYVVEVEGDKDEEEDDWEGRELDDVNGEDKESTIQIRYVRKKGKKRDLTNKEEVKAVEPESFGDGQDDEEDRNGQDLESKQETTTKAKIQKRHRKSVNVIEEDLAAPEDEDELFDQRSIRLEKRKKRKAKILEKSVEEDSLAIQDQASRTEEDQEQDERELEESPATIPKKEPIVIRYTRTKGKLPKKPKKKLPVDKADSDGEKPPEAAAAAAEEGTVSLEDSTSSKDRPPIGPIRYKRTKGHYKRPSNVNRARETVTVDIPTEADILDSDKPQYCSAPDDDEEDEDCNKEDPQTTIPIEIRYFRTKGTLLPKKKKKKKLIPIEEEEEDQGGEEEEEDGGEEDEEEEDGDEIDEEEEKKDEAEKEVQEKEEKEKSQVPLKIRYRKQEITNVDDNLIRDKLDIGDRLIEDERKYEAARDHFSALLKTHPESPRINYGYARALDRLSEKQQSNAILETSIGAYEKVLDLPNVPESLYRKVLDRMVDRARFRGWPQKAVAFQRKAVERFPYNYHIRNQYGLTFLLMGRNQDAKRIFQEVLHDDGENGFAHMHYGFILKTADGDQEGAVEHMSKGMASRAEGTDHPRFYFHLGDALQRTGKKYQAYKLYDEAASRGYFLSRMQRSLYNCDGLTGRPWWTLRQTGVQEQLEELERHWQTIRAEGLALLDSKDRFFKSEDEKLTNSGNWKQYTLFQRGKKVESNCARAPKTCALIEQFKEAAQCQRGQVKFSIMSGGTRVHPHCGPTNCRLRAHLGLAIPIEPRIRVANETRNWRLGKFIVLDDSFEHEVWHDGTLRRLILIVDFWHPQVTPAQRKSLSAI